MKLTIHKQLGDTAIDTTVEGSVDDCLKVIDRLEDTKGKKCKIELSGQVEDIKTHMEKATERWLRKQKCDHLFSTDEKDQQIIYLYDTNEYVAAPLHLNLDGVYSLTTLSDFQKALQEEVNKGTLFL